MKKIFKYFLVIILLFTTAPLVAQAQLDEESIQSFDVQVKMNADATLNVSETIVYETLGIFKSTVLGIFYTNTKPAAAITICEFPAFSSPETALDALCPSRFPTGDNKRIRIGNTMFSVTGEQTYVINYSVRRAIIFLTTTTSCYWNVTGENSPHTHLARVGHAYFAAGGNSRYFESRLLFRHLRQIPK